MNDTINILGQQVPVALLLVYLQNWLKKQSWFPWVDYKSTRLNHLLAAGLAGLATLGVHESHTGSVMTGGVITIVMPPLTTLLVGVWHWVTQHLITKAMYDGWLQQKLSPPTEVKTP